MGVKKAIRMLGTAESFKKTTGKRSVLAGVVMRADLIVDGFTFGLPTVGGMDATEELVQAYNLLNREDINVIGVSGNVISWYNVIDFHRAYEKIGVPLISITYEESEGLEPYFKKNFPLDWERRVEIYRKNGSRTKVKLKTDYEVFIRGYGLRLEKAVEILNVFTLSGRYPEPIKAARMLSHIMICSSIVK